MVGRFINADDAIYLLLQLTEFSGTNLYAYCLNDPVNYIDPNGDAVITLTTATVLGILALFGLIGGVAYVENEYHPIENALRGATDIIVSLFNQNVASWSTTSLGSNADYFSGYSSQFGAAVFERKKKADDKFKKDYRRISDILKKRKGSIKSAPPPKGFPGWEELIKLTVAEAYRLYNDDGAVWSFIKKLLTDKRFSNRAIYLILISLALDGGLK